MTANLLNDKEWRLRSLTIDFMEWGEYKGKYIGKIKFGNNQSEAFSFNIPEEKATLFLSLIRDNIVDSAHELGNRVLQSMPELQGPKTSGDNLQISI